MGLSWGSSFVGFKNLIKSTEKRVQKEIQDVVTDTGKHIKRRVKQLTPVDTGKLRRSWKLRNKGKGAKRQAIITNAALSKNGRWHYGTLLEYGTIKIAPRRFFKRSLMSGSRYMNRRMRRIKLMR